ncbi:hypothetical protein ACI3KX_03850 [Microbacterium sp. ZW CA_36]|uniref:hypothetical protein n=1 Tax=Microbacterium sp. ZW CA_36 TaxID=3378078 RepID=UPI003854EE88
MMNDDDRLTAMLRASNPARTPLDAGPDAAALAVRDRIMGAGHVRPRVLPRVMWVAAAAFVVIAVAAVSILVPRAPAAAVTPAPIAFTSGGTVEEVVRMAEEKLAAAPGPEVSSRFARSESWGLSVDVDEQRSEIVPQVMTLEWNPDLSGRMTVVAGEPYWPAGAARQGEGEATAPGETLSEMEFAAGQWNTPVVDLPGASREDMFALLTAFGMPESPTASDVIQAVTGVFEQWTLTNEQQGQLLRILEESGGMTVLGSGTDRAGRDVVGLETKSIFPGVEDMVLISAETGRIVGVESTRVTPDGIVPAGAVISYRMWGTD